MKSFIGRHRTLRLIGYITVAYTVTCYTIYGVHAGLKHWAVGASPDNAARRYTQTKFHDRLEALFGGRETR